MSTASSSSSSAWLMSPAHSTSTTGTWMVVDQPPPEIIKDLPPPWWSPSQPFSKCCNCGCPVYATVRYPEFPGACQWCHTGMVHLFRRFMRPSPWGWPDSAERQWRADLLRFYKTVIEKRRAYGFQNRVSTPNAETIEESPLLANVNKVPRIRVDPQRVQELRDLPSWRPVEPVVQLVLAQSIEAVEADVKSLTVAQLKPILRAEGLRVSGAKAQMQEQIINPYLVAHAKVGLNGIASSMSDAPMRQDPKEAIASQLLKKHGQSPDSITGSQHEGSPKAATVIESDWRKT
ncbi:hypothetical protein MMC27_005833 [Xylographa pallens]|nr:hypothetical protein [Xylographa pallens]